jgi:hypothetical protein
MICQMTTQLAPPFILLNGKVWEPLHLWKDCCPVIKVIHFLNFSGYSWCLCWRCLFEPGQWVQHSKSGLVQVSSVFSLLDWRVEWGLWRAFRKGALQSRCGKRVDGRLWHISFPNCACREHPSSWVSALSNGRPLLARLLLLKLQQGEELRWSCCFSHSLHSSRHQYESFLLTVTLGAKTFSIKFGSNSINLFSFLWKDRQGKIFLFFKSLLCHEVNFQEEKYSFTSKVFMKSVTSG